MKKYIKPNIDIHQIELVLMQPDSGLKQIDPDTKVDNPINIDSKETSFDSNSVWGDEEE